jgi:RNA chaperone Hfq
MQEVPSMETNLLDRMLNTYLREQIPVTATLQNKIRVSGKIRAFDSYVIVLDGQKQEILYRHAISSLASYVPEEQKRQPIPNHPAPAALKPPARPAKNISSKPRPVRQPQSTPLAASASDPGINNTMKDGLLRWMQEQKAAK